MAIVVTGQRKRVPHRRRSSGSILRRSGPEGLHHCHTPSCQRLFGKSTEEACHKTTVAGRCVQTQLTTELFMLTIH
jgi:hypothetical protein